MSRPQNPVPKVWSPAHRWRSPVARAMVDLAISVIGTAGTGGGSAYKTVG
jgi:hypothetical protein